MDDIKGNKTQTLLNMGCYKATLEFLVIIWVYNYEPPPPPPPQQQQQPQ